MNPVSKLPGGLLPELIRFSLGSLIMLGCKILLMMGLQRLLSELPAYFVVQVILFFASYFLHSFLSFRREASYSGMWEYFKIIVGFQFVDWLFFAVIFTRFRIESTYVILMATVFVFLLRFLFVRRSFRRAARRDAPENGLPR